MIKHQGNRKYYNTLHYHWLTCKIVISFWSLLYLLCHVCHLEDNYIPISLFKIVLCILLAFAWGRQIGSNCLSGEMHMYIWAVNYFLKDTFGIVSYNFLKWLNVEKTFCQLIFFKTFMHNNISPIWAAKNRSCCFILYRLSPIKQPLQSRSLQRGQ